MFIKKLYSKNYEYLQIVESYREGSKVKHRTIANLGRTDQLSRMKNWKDFSAALEMVCSGKASIDVDSMTEEGRYNWGLYAIYKKVWDWFKLDDILGGAFADSRIRFDYRSAMMLEVMTRMYTPSSKRKLFLQQDKFYGINEVSLHNLYRVLDHLADKKEIIEEALFKRHKKRFKIPVNIVLYDVTTLYFESVHPDEIRKHGFSKDHKAGEVQVVLALFTNEEGRPLGYHLYPGNTAETKTLVDALKKIKTRFKVKEVIIVADRGINSKSNLLTIAEKTFDYVFACRLKSMPQHVKDKATNIENYTKANGEEDLRYMILNYTNPVHDPTSSKNVTLEENIICTWSKKRSEKDKKDRLRAIEKATEDLKHPASLSGRKRYIKAKGDQKYELDKKKIAADEKWDGFYAIQTSKKAMSASEILRIYHELWRIEESFRTLKHSLEIRPMFHWTEKRIKGHVMICFISFLLEKTLQIELSKEGKESSFDEIKEAINQMEFSKITTSSESQYYLFSKMTPIGNNLLKRVRIKRPSNIMTPEDFAEKMTVC